MDALVPTRKEIEDWLLHVVQHSCHVEYWLHEFKIGAKDPERPHDLVGPGNKLEWNVLRGFAVQNRDHSPEFFTKYVKPALDCHRQQYHHQRWNEPNPYVTDDDLRVGAVDAVCSLLESREYQGGRHSYDQIIEIANRNPEHRRKWLIQMAEIMRLMKQPQFEQITSTDTIQNIGLPSKVLDSIRVRLAFACNAEDLVQILDKLRHERT